MVTIRAKLYDRRRTYRDILVDPSGSLFELARYVVAAFDFDFDHCFGFFASPDVYGRGKDATHYELFYDIDEEVDELAKSVKQTPVSELFGTKSDKWWMLFDYGDDWVFELECVDTNSAGVSGIVCKRMGEAPLQYGEMK